jgi:hypothetical protein
MPQFQSRAFAPLTPRNPIPKLKMPNFTTEKNTSHSQKFREKGGKTKQPPGVESPTACLTPAKTALPPRQ